MSPRAHTRLRGRALALVTLVLTCLLLEGALRVVLFSDLARGRFGWRVRQAGLCTPVEGGRELWKLRARLAGPAAARPHPGRPAPAARPRATTSPPPGVNHYTAASNAVVFEAQLDGLKGRFE
jgi:hypothetical protein